MLRLITRELDRACQGRQLMEGTVDNIYLIHGSVGQMIVRRPAGLSLQPYDTLHDVAATKKNSCLPPGACQQGSCNHD